MNNHVLQNSQNYNAWNCCLASFRLLSPFLLSCATLEWHAVYIVSNRLVFGRGQIWCSFNWHVSSPPFYHPRKLMDTNDRTFRLSFNDGLQQGFQILNGSRSFAFLGVDPPTQNLGVMSCRCRYEIADETRKLQEWGVQASPWEESGFNIRPTKYYHAVTDQRGHARASSCKQSKRKENPGSWK